MSGQDGGLLAGLPLSIKDLTAVKGVRFTSGSRTLADFISPHDSPVSERKAHGAAIVGKTTTTEFGCKASSDSPLTGATRNPWTSARPPAAPPAGAGKRRRRHHRSRSGPTAAARSGFRPRSAACSGSRRSSAAFRCFRRRRRRRSPMSARWRARCAMRRCCSPPSPASTRAIRRASPPRCRTSRRLRAIAATPADRLEPDAQLRLADGGSGGDRRQGRARVRGAGRHSRAGRQACVRMPELWMAEPWRRRRHQAQAGR